MAGASRIQDLMAAVRDVHPSPAAAQISVADAGREHRARFDRYVKELRKARRTADQWWKGLVESETERVGDERHADINVRTKRPPGPVINPAVIHTIRSAWLDCQNLNDRAPEGARVAPEVFVLLWLQQSGKGELADFVAGLPSWPMGLDDSGRWV